MSEALFFAPNSLTISTHPDPLWGLLLGPKRPIYWFFDHFQQ
jgi:hypothetical protein